MPTEHTEFFGRMILGLSLLFAALFAGILGAGGYGVQAFVPSETNLSEEYPPWNVSGAAFNGTTETGGTLEFETAQAGTVSWTGPILDQGDLIAGSHINYNASIDPTQNQSVAVRIFSSSDNFRTIKNSDSIQLKDGVGIAEIELAPQPQYRVQVLLSQGGTETAPALNSLQLEGNQIDRSFDFSLLFRMIIVWILLLSALFVVVPAG